MPGRYCAVKSCKNNQIALKAVGNNDVIFHCFPIAKDLVSRTIEKQWIHRCKKSDKFNPKNSWVCSNHFTKNDYERDLQHELLGLPLRRKLKKTAVPTLNLETIIDEEKENSSEVAQPEMLLHASNFNDHKISASKCPIVESIPEALEASSGQHETGLPLLDNKQKFPLEDPQPLDNNNYKYKYEQLLKKYNTLKLQSRNKIRNLNNLMNYYKRKYYNNPIKKTAKTQIAEEILNMVLTKNQINLLSERRKKVVWTREEISVAFTIRYYSKKCYLYLRDKLNYPLPALSSLRRWASQINVSQGVLDDVLMMMKLAGEDLTDFEKTVVLQFDEVKVRSIEEYEIAQDQVLGPHSQMQVVQARGLFSKWKQPIYIAFDQKITKEILFTITKELHNISYNVVACVSDCGGGNIGLWRELGVNIEKCFFSHPETNQNIYMFADAPHLLKLLRNWLLDTGFILEGEKKITKEPLQKLIDSTNNEVNPCWKINQNHLDCEGTQRQNVRMAAQLLSHNVAEALYRYKPGSDKKMCEDLSEFVNDVDKWFDIFNSYVKDGKVPFKSAFGVHLEEQEAHLIKMESTISTMRAIGKGSLQMFQKGMIMSMKSIKMLFKDMKNDFNIKYICTHKLNQDSLENFFAQLRSRGPNEHPSPLTAIYRIRMIILGKNSGILDAKVNTNEPTAEEYMTPNIFEKVKINTDQEKIHDLTFGSYSSSSFSSNGSLETPDNKPSLSGNTGVNLPEMTEDALEYIAGWLAKKYKQDFPNLGDHTYKIKSDDHNYNIPSWVQQLSFGGLIKPTHEWLAKIKKWEKYFIKHHSNGFRKDPGVVKLLARKISKKDHLPLQIISKFCKLRTIIKINFNNLQVRQNQRFKRRNISTDSNRTKVRKYNKIVN